MSDNYRPRTSKHCSDCESDIVLTSKSFLLFLVFIFGVLLAYLLYPISFSPLVSQISSLGVFRVNSEANFSSIILSLTLLTCSGIVLIQYLNKQNPIFLYYVILFVLAAVPMDVNLIIHDIGSAMLYLISIIGLIINRKEMLNILLYFAGFFILIFYISAFMGSRITILQWIFVPLLVLYISIDIFSK